MQIPYRIVKGMSKVQTYNLYKKPRKGQTYYAFIGSYLPLQLANRPLLGSKIVFKQVKVCQSKRMTLFIYFKNPIQTSLVSVLD